MEEGRAVRTGLLPDRFLEDGRAGAVFLLVL
jgi:hypothetical protein